MGFDTGTSALLICDITISCGNSKYLSPERERIGSFGSNTCNTELDVELYNFISNTPTPLLVFNGDMEPIEYFSTNWDSLQTSLSRVEGLINPNRFKRKREVQALILYEVSHWNRLMRTV